MQILPLEVKIFMNIQLDVICADMVDFRRLGHKWQQCLCSTHPEGGHLIPMTPCV